MRAWIAGCAFLAGLCPARGGGVGPINPVSAAAAGDTVYVALHGRRAVARVAVSAGTVAGEWAMADAPTGVAVAPRGDRVAVTMGEALGRVAIVAAATGVVEREWEAGFSPVNPVFLERGDVVAVCNRFTHSVGFHRAATGERLAEVKVSREPVAAVVSADGRRLFVGCHLPAQAATAAHVAAAVEVIDVARRRRESVIDLPDGGTAMHGMALSPDGKLLFVAHLVGHHRVPTTQLERGWMNANALTVIDAISGGRIGTVLLDDTTLGAANPWGVAVTADGAYVAVAHSGTDEVSRIPMGRLLAILWESVGSGGAGGEGYGVEEGVVRDLTVMTRAGRARLKMPGLGPRAVVAVGNRVAVCEYFSGTLAVLDLFEPEARRVQARQIALGAEPAPDETRLGEMRFADARLCFQGWQSCMSCHPSVRADGLNWDLLNDGIGNPKQTKSMLFTHATPPAMGHGVRATAEMAVRSGIRFIQFAGVKEDQARAIDAFLKSLRPAPSPRLVEGGLSPLAREGRAVFEKAGCARCHEGEYYTNQRSYRMKYATGGEAEREFDTPSLREVWRTGPYLYDGRAATMEEALRIKMEKAPPLGEGEFHALVEYVMSL